MDRKVLYMWLGGEFPGYCTEKLALLAEFGGIGELYQAGEDELREAFSRIGCRSRKLFAGLTDKDLEAAEERLEKCRKFGASVICEDEPEYPLRLRDLSDRPVVLYAKGNTALFGEPSVAVVGTRRCSPYGRRIAREIGRKLALAGVTVVSGMAEGIDSSAHRGCLDAAGNTVAVFGTGIDICFPLSNQSLFDEISSAGLILSELPPGVRGAAQNFPQRNRIISGLAGKVIVVEGAAKSGSMITAELALKNGRDVYAVPGNIDQPNSYGTNSLIFDGATPILSMEDLYPTLGICGFTEKQRVETMTKEERTFLNSLREAPGCTLQYLTDVCGLDAVTTARIGSAMELKGLIRREGQRIYVTN